MSGRKGFIVKVLLVAALGAATLCLASKGDDQIQVKTDKGTLNGLKVNISQDDTLFEYFSFRGIKYAQPPVGKLRFQDPVEVDVEDEEIDATEDGNACVQHDILGAAIQGDEDCLYLNVHSTKLSATEKRPVVVYIHGGGFVTGTAASYAYSPEYLLKSDDVVVVTINYRLGPFGFLATSDKAATGNFGLKDQIMALKWIQRNIAAFGGDPNSVTLIGEEAGASMVSLHMLSPESKGLFHRAVLMSGNALCDQHFQPEPQNAAEELAKELGCTSMKGEDILTCISEFRMQEIARAAKDLTRLSTFPRHFAPSVDGVVVLDLPEAVLSSGKIVNKVPVISGYPKEAGGWYFRPVLNTFTATGTGYDDTFLDHRLPRVLPVISRVNTKLYPVTRQVKKKYFLNVDMSDEDEFRPRFVNFLTDFMFTRCVAKFNQLLTEQGVPTYAYSFDYKGQYSFPNLMGEANEIGVVVTDDVQYLFNTWDGQLEMSKSDMKFLSNTYLPLITNFVKTSVPTKASDSVSWTPIEVGKNKVLSINTKLTMIEGFKQEKIKFWEEDIPKLFTAKKSVTKKKTKDEL